MHYEIDGLVTFGVAIAEAATGEPIDPSEMEGDGEAWIDYRGPPGTFDHYSYSRVLRGEVPASAFRGKTVIVGASAPSLQDVHPTSTTGNELMAGPEVQANAAWTAEHGFPLSSSGLVVDLLLILLMASAPAAATLRMSALPALLVAIGLGLVYARRRPARLRRGHRAAGRLPAAGADPLGARCAGGQLRAQRARAPARPRHLRPLRSRGGRQRSARPHRRRPAPRRHAARGDGSLQRPARLHQLLRVAAAGRGDRGPEPLPGGDERRDHGPRRHPRRLHGRRHHGRLRRAARAARPRRPRARGGAGDARRAAAALQRLDARRRGWAGASTWASASTAAR